MFVFSVLAKKNEDIDLANMVTVADILLKQVIGTHRRTVLSKTMGECVRGKVIKH